MFGPRVLRGKDLKCFSPHLCASLINRRSLWYPQGIKLLKGNRATKAEETANTTHNLGDKTIADVCEALIGAALLSQRNTNNVDMAVKAVSVMVSNPLHEVTKWSEYWCLYNKPAWQLDQSTASQSDLAAQVEDRHKYKFHYPRLLRSAFTHPSYGYAYEKIPSYQRLEFLGDALLDMVCIKWLFDEHPNKDPQWLTEHKVGRDNVILAFSLTNLDGDGFE